jgi:hypothetical protein
MVAPSEQTSSLAVAGKESAHKRLQTPQPKLSCAQGVLASQQRDNRRTVYMASMEALVVSRSFLLPSFEI